MDKKYYAWRDRQCNGVNPVWDEYTGPEFYQFLQRPENAGRRFIRLGNDVDMGDCVITIEATPEQYRDWMIEERRKSRRRKDRVVQDLISLDDTADGTGEDAGEYLGFLYGEEDEGDQEPRYREETVDGPEDDVLDRLVERQLLSALQHLTAAERSLMELLYVKKLSLRETGKTMGITYSTVQGRRDDALRKLRKYL